MKIVITDGYTVNPGDLSWNGFSEFGSVTAHDRIPFDQAAQTIGDAEAALVCKVPVTAQVMEKCPKLRYIGVLATGYNNVDVAAAAARGIAVTNVPDYGTETVAEYTMALLLGLCHGVESQSASVHRGDWSKAPDFCYYAYAQTSVRGKVMGLVGLGRIGRAVAELAGAFGMTVVAYTPQGDTAAGVEAVSLEELCRRADVISLHCPLTEETRGIINAKTLSLMKPGASLLNTSRGQLVDETALVDALKSGRLRAAALDVVSEEPMRPENPLLDAPNCIITPHSAWLTPECRWRIAETAEGNLRAYIAGNRVNRVD